MLHGLELYIVVLGVLRVVFGTRFKIAERRLGRETRLKYECSLCSQSVYSTNNADTCLSPHSLEFVLHILP